jgi:hypothetical protein
MDYTTIIEHIMVAKSNFSRVTKIYQNRTKNMTLIGQNKVEGGEHLFASSGDQNPRRNL